MTEEKSWYDKETINKAPLGHYLLRLKGSNRWSQVVMLDRQRNILLGKHIEAYGPFAGPNTIDL